MAKSKPLYMQLSNGQVFYVGKGHGKRAWEKKRRHRKWLERIATLGDDWEVAIVRDDLSEIEAFALEEELTIQFGRAAFDGGTLANQIPGGENPVSASITVDLEERLGCWIEVYEVTRKFRDFSQDECQVFVDRLMHDLRSILNKLEEINESDPPEAIADSVLDLDCIVGSLIDNGGEFLRHRIGWQDIALSLEEAVEDLQPADVDGMHRRIRPLARKAAGIVLAALKEIDSGNKMEAEAAANRAVL